MPFSSPGNLPDPGPGKFPKVPGRRRCQCASALSAGAQSPIGYAQLCPTLCHLMNCTVHGILQARILEWVALPFSRGSSQPRDRTQVSHAIRRGEGAQRKRCRDPRCSPRGNPACRGTFGGRRKAVRAGEGIGYPLHYSWASLVVQLVKNPSATRETWVQSLGWEDPLEKGKATHSSILAWRTPCTV